MSEYQKFEVVSPWKAEEPLLEKAGDGARLGLRRGEKNQNKQP
jgi:hypothetical protein